MNQKNNEIFPLSDAKSINFANLENTDVTHLLLSVQIQLKDLQGNPADPNNIEKKLVFGPIAVLKQGEEANIATFGFNQLPRKAETIIEYMESIKENSFDPVDSIAAGKVKKQGVDWDTLLNSSVASSSVQDVTRSAFISTLEQGQFALWNYIKTPFINKKDESFIIAALIGMGEEKIIENNDILVEYFEMSYSKDTIKWSNRKPYQKDQFMEEFKKVEQKVWDIVENDENAMDYIRKHTITYTLDNGDTVDLIHPVWHSDYPSLENHNISNDSVISLEIVDDYQKEVDNNVNEE